MECSSVNVNVLYGDMAPENWALEFCGPGFKFEVSEPAMFTKAAWENLCVNDTRCTRAMAKEPLRLKAI
jgi:hypothetical protein